ncbi:MAG TPA: hypothetical protein DDZ51_16815 [Planctomycetaceae bacterium]|nr:hypothetical protein [Planctomycetaceae bacterium]
MSRQQLELLVNDDSLRVPFGIVELQAAEGQLANLNVQRQPSVPAVPEDIRKLSENAWQIILPNEWFRLVFYYVSLIAYEPIANVNAISTPEAWQSTLDAARSASPNRPVANTLVFDGLPAAENCFPRIVSQAAFHAIHRIMTWTEFQWTVQPYNRLKPAQTPTPDAQESTRTKILVVFSSDPTRSREQIENIKTQLSFVPEFFDELRPINQEMVPDVSYLQVDNSSGKPICRTRSLLPDQSQVLSEALVHVDTSIPWDAMVYGDSLADSILHAYDLHNALPAKRIWPANCPEFPHNWARRELSDDIPRYPGEPDVNIAVYPKGPERLLLDRWLFWSWQSGRWTWAEIYEDERRKASLARDKRDASGNPDRARTARKRASDYAEWIKCSLRSGR